MNTPLYYGSVGIFGADHLRCRKGVRERFAALLSRFGRFGRRERAMRVRTRTRTRHEQAHPEHRLPHAVGLARVDTL